MLVLIDAINYGDKGGMATVLASRHAGDHPIQMATQDEGPRPAGVNRQHTQSHHIGR